MNIATRGPGGQVRFVAPLPAWFSDPAQLAVGYNRHLVRELGSVGRTVKTEAASAYAGTRFAAGFHYTTAISPYGAGSLIFTHANPLFPDVELPTKRHVIRAKHKPFLVFKVDGHWVKVKEVNHPGTAGKGYLTQALAHAEPQVVAAMQRALEAAIRG
jgi:hypothetical protein